MAPSNTPPSNRLRDTLRAMALYEALKGVAAIGGLLGLLDLLHHNLHRLALELIGHLHLDPRQHFSEWLLEAADRVNATPVHTLVLLTLTYATMRFIESWGLWHDRAWGEWFGVVSTVVYIPFEVQHLMHEVTWPSVLVLVFNLMLALILLFRLRQRRQQAAAAAANQTSRAGRPIRNTGR